MSHPEATHSDETIWPPTDTRPAANSPQISHHPTAIHIPERSQPVNRQQPHSCNGCDNRWGGYNTSHCAACHQTFTGLTAFDKHRDGDHARGTRGCMPPAAVGLVDASRDYPCWGFPGDPDRQFGAAAETDWTVDELAPMINATQELER